MKTESIDYLLKMLKHEIWKKDYDINNRYKEKKDKECPTDEKFAEGIAKAHIKEDKNYYDKLNKAGL